MLYGSFQTISSDETTNDPLRRPKQIVNGLSERRRNDDLNGRTDSDKVSSVTQRFSKRHRDLATVSSKNGTVTINNGVQNTVCSKFAISMLDNMLIVLKTSL